MVKRRWFKFSGPKVSWTEEDGSKKEYDQEFIEGTFSNTLGRPVTLSMGINLAAWGFGLIAVGLILLIALAGWEYETSGDYLENGDYQEFHHVKVLTWTLPPHRVETISREEHLSRETAAGRIKLDPEFYREGAKIAPVVDGRIIRSKKKSRVDEVQEREARRDD